MRAAIKRYVKSVTAAPAFEEFAEYGTGLAVSWCSDLGMLSVRNFTATQYAAAAATDASAVGRYVQHTHGCRGCPIGCKAEVRVAAGRFAELAGERPDFEPLVAWGAKVGIDDVTAVLHLHNQCDRLGLDSVSAGGVAAFAIELFERGLIDTGDTGGRTLHWGDAEALAGLLDEMAAGKGFGGMLGGGVRRAALALGNGSEAYAFEVKGLELPAYDPRGAFGAALSFAVGARGGDFTNDYARQEFNLTPAEGRALYGDELAATPTSPRGKAAVVCAAMIASAALDALGLCKIPMFSLLNDYRLERTAELATAVSGRPLTAVALLHAGRRIVTMERLFNLRCGATAADDTLPARFLDEPLSGGPNRGVVVDLAPMKAELYALLGWGPDGVPTPATLAELGIEHLTDHDDERERS